MRKGVFFSTDALIAVVVILIVLLAFRPDNSVQFGESDIDADVLSALSSLRVYESNDDYVQSLVSQGSIMDVNKTLLEQIGELYVTAPDAARTLAAQVLGNINASENFGLWYGSTLIYSSNSSDFEGAEDVSTSRRVISGLNQGESVTGYSARALLSTSLKSDYFYFGGYVGDGNLTTRIFYSGEINSAEIEIAVQGEFDVYVNGQLEGHYFGTGDDFLPTRQSLSVDNFVSGENFVEISGDNIHIAGGFVKIGYQSDVQFDPEEKKYLSGVEGLVNVYDGIVFPENFTSFEALVHVNSNFTSMFITLGNETIYSGATNGEASLFFDDSNLSSLLDYDSLNGKTIPFRIGLENVSYIGVSQGVDVFSVTDLSGSMCGSCSGGGFVCCLFGGCNNNEQACTNCNGHCSNTAISSARDSNKIFIDALLNFSENRMGLVGYASSAPASDYHALSTNNVSLKAEVDSWRASGGTCICCGINSAASRLAGVVEDKLKVIVLMSDGVANVGCQQQGTTTAAQDAIKAACDAHEDYGITVHSIGFGSEADEATLQAIAECGEGYYYYSDVDELSEIYQQVANSIIADYEEQTLEAQGSVFTKLYSDSYVKVSTPVIVENYGLIATVEKEFEDNSYGVFEVPGDANVLSAYVASYSGSRWTDKVYLNGLEIYDLSSYGDSYISLGDPFIVSLPKEFIHTGANFVNLTTALSPQNSSVGSVENKIIYTLLKNASAYSPIVATANGCLWNIIFEDSSSISVPVPANYSGTDVCSYNGTSIVYNENDAVQFSVLALLRQLDLDLDGYVDVLFDEQELQISVNEVTGIPFTWSTEVQVRRWR